MTKSMTDRKQWLAIGLLALAVSIVTYFVDAYRSEVAQAKVKQSEISQIVMDEGFRSCRYKDSLGFATIGFGHLVTKEDTNLGRCITPVQAIALLRADYDEARGYAQEIYPWADEPMLLVLTNMTYQLGPTRLAQFKNFLSAAEQKQYDKAASEMLDSLWARQSPKRTQRLVGRVMQMVTND